jgi:hypothetical protein
VRHPGAAGELGVLGKVQGFTVDRITIFGLTQPIMSMSSARRDVLIREPDGSGR